jgi:hypothetical protein
MNVFQMKKSEKLLGLEFNRISSWNLHILDESWKRYLYSHLVSNSTHGEEFEVPSRKFLTWIKGLKLK